MTPHPATISTEELASRALDLMERRKITSLMVTDESGQLVGILHLHNLWGTQLF